MISGQRFASGNLMSPARRFREAVTGETGQDKFGGVFYIHQAAWGNEERIGSFACAQNRVDDIPAHVDQICIITVNEKLLNCGNSFSLQDENNTANKFQSKTGPIGRCRRLIHKNGDQADHCDGQIGDT